MIKLKPLIKIARIDHWIKQLFIIPGIIFALFLIKDYNLNICKIAFAFLSTCLVASANYIINEYLDKDFDKYHPTKKNRTLVVENVNVKLIILDYIVFAFIGLTFGILAGIEIFIVEIWLLFMGIIYNVKPVRTKDIPVLDVLSESINNVIRLLIGWFAVTNNYLPPISIVFGYWMVGAFLMNTKRYAEYMLITNKKDAALYRKSFKYYDEIKLLLLSVFYAIMSIFFLGIVIIKYRIELLLLIPLMAIFFCYYISLAYKKDSATAKPEKLYKEKWLMIFIIILILSSIILLRIDIPFLNVFLTNDLIKINM